MNRLYWIVACPGIVLSTLLLMSAPLRAAPSEAQSDTERLSRTITLMDRDMFDAFNDCNMADFAKYYDEEVEFYHDQTGLSISRDTLVKDVQKNICGKQRRERTGRPFEIFPLANHGALQMGEHEWHLLKPQRYTRERPRLK